MPVDRIAVALPSPRPQILDRTFGPLRGHIADPQVTVRLDLLTAATAG